MDALRRQCSLAACALLAIALTACATDPQAKNTDPAQRAKQTAAQAQELLVPWQTVTGGLLAAGGVDANGFPLPGAMQGYAALVFPSALAARGDDLYIADSGARKLYRFDAAFQLMIQVPGVEAMPWTRMQVGPDQSLYVLDAARASILHYTRGMQPLQTLGDPSVTASLDGFVVDGLLGRIVASDRLGQRLVMFNPLGGAAWPMEHAGEGEFTSLGALTGAGRALYAIDSVCTCIVSLDETGRILVRIGKGELAQPQALAADRHGHIFVADAADRTLKVFLRGDLAASYSTHKLGLIEISALAVDEDTLYIADGPGARVLSFRIQGIGDKGRETEGNMELQGYPEDAR